MFWVCPMCSSNNEGCAVVCMVCGATRPSTVLHYDIQAQMNNASGGVSDLLGAYKAFDAEASYRSAVRTMETDMAAGVAVVLECAKRGYAPAQDRVAHCYRHGLGVPRDDLQAVYWYKQAARAGVASAQVGLGDCYREGCGTIKDDAAAYDWYRRAAEQGDAAGKYKVGFCYRYGIGVKTDMEKARYFFRQAASGGNVDAQAALLEMSS